MLCSGILPGTGWVYCPRIEWEFSMQCFISHFCPALQGDLKFCNKILKDPFSSLNGLSLHIFCEVILIFNKRYDLSSLMYLRSFKIFILKREIHFKEILGSACFRNESLPLNGYPRDLESMRTLLRVCNLMGPCFCYLLNSVNS